MTLQSSSGDAMAKSEIYGSRSTKIKVDLPNIDLTRFLKDISYPLPPPHYVFPIISFYYIL
jgi:hypothetical protein